MHCKEAYLEGLGKTNEKVSYYLDGIRNQTPLNYHIGLFCFPLELECSQHYLFSATLMFLRRKKLRVLCTKFIKLTHTGDGSNLSRAHFHTQHTDFDESWY
jgi:hypothetical protein